MTGASAMTSGSSPQWWRLALLALVCVAGAAGALGCTFAWLLLGFMGTPIQPWQPVAHAAGVAVCVAVPVIVGRAVLRAGRAPSRWTRASMAVALLSAGLLAGAVLAASA